MDTRVQPYEGDRMLCGYTCKWLHSVAAYCKLFAVCVGDLERRTLTRCAECKAAEKAGSRTTMLQRVQRALEAEKLVIIDRDYMESLIERKLKGA